MRFAGTAYDAITDGRGCTATGDKPLQNTPFKDQSLTRKPLRNLLLACFALGCASLAHADIVVTPTFDLSNQAAPPDTTDYEGNFYDGTSAPYDITIGTFDFSIPADYVVTGATISGTFGDVNSATTALADLYVDGGNIKVAGCDDYSAACFNGTVDGSLVAWSYTFTNAELSALTSGSLDFAAIQNSFSAVVIGSPTLDIQLTQTPEPSSAFALAGALLAFAAWRRRK